MYYRKVKPSDGKYVLSPVNPETSDLIFVEPIPGITEEKINELYNKYKGRFLVIFNREDFGVFVKEFQSIPEITEGKR